MGNVDDYSGRLQDRNEALPAAAVEPVAVLSYAELVAELAVNAGVS